MENLPSCTLEMLNRIPSGIGVYNIINGVLKQVYLNDGFFKIIRDTRENHDAGMKSNAMNGVHPDDREAMKNLVKNLCSGSDNASITVRALCGDGEYVWIRMTASVVKRGRGMLTIYASFSDYDGTMRAQEELRQANAALKEHYEQEQHKRTFLERDSAASLVYNVTRDRLTEFKCAKMPLYSHFENISAGECMADLFKNMPDKGDRATLADCFDRSTNLRLFQKGTYVRRAEFRFRCTDGCLRWFSAYSRMDMEEATGDVISYIFVKDIDVEKKNALATMGIIGEGTDYILLLNTVTGAARVLHLSRSYGYRMFNPSNEFNYDLFRTNSESALYRVLPENLEAVKQFFDRKLLAESLKTKSVAAITFSCRRNDGSIQHKKIQAFFLDGLHEDIVIISRDITDLYEEEQAQKRKLQNALDYAKKANSAKSDFLSRMSHDMRTPLNAVLSFARLAKNEAGIPVRAADYLDKVNTSGEYLLSLINDVLDMAKIESGKMTLREESVDGPKFLEHIAEVFRAEAEKKGIALITDFTEARTPWVILDSLRTHRIYANLLSNAIKFSKSGTEIRWTVRNIPTGPGTMRTVSRVSDQGCGISEKFMMKLFEPFEQADTSYTVTGTGLGLSITSKLITLMGGTIRAESVQGKGTTFTVEFDRKIGHPQAKLKSAPAVKPASLAGRRVLICEDNKLNTQIAIILLEKAGVVVECAGNGEIGTEMFKASPPWYYDAVLMDILMPEMDGLEAAKVIRGMDRPDVKVPIIALSANAFEEDRKKSLDAGMNDHLAKPLDPQRLYGVLAKQITAYRKTAKRPADS